MCDMHQLFISTTWSQWHVLGANKAPPGWLVVCCWVRDSDKGKEGTAQWAHTACHHTVSLSLFVIQYYVQCSDSVLHLITPDSGIHLSLTPSGYCFQCLNGKRTACLYLPKKIKHENISFFPSFVASYAFPSLSNLYVAQRSFGFLTALKFTVF